MYEEWLSTLNIPYKMQNKAWKWEWKSNVRIYETFIITAQKKIKQDTAKIKLQASEL